MLLAFVVLGLVFSTEPSHDWEERRRNDLSLFCVECIGRKTLTQSIKRGSRRNLADGALHALSKFTLTGAGDSVLPLRQTPSTF